MVLIDEQKRAEKNANKKCICSHLKYEHNWIYDVSKGDETEGDEMYWMKEKVGKCLVCSCPKFKTVWPWSKPKKFDLKKNN